MLPFPLRNQHVTAHPVPVPEWDTAQKSQTETTNQKLDRLLAAQELQERVEWADRKGKNALS